ncbi:hypothetical protein [Halopseudomonas salegens]|uniref:Uncharacterized protein n=1 Tax=Halopseudomonas salegens TaxID=1434072 RepID=A0A1H2HBT8_9GAMM|nr:hypothetical protein [Halopseudomonas salegens]SDU29330.1 hypothetical protein SAMN05216210_2927 [Halopseudomonas salegens]
MKSPEYYLQNDVITRHAMKRTGLSFDALMTTRLELPSDAPQRIGGWLVCWSGTLAPEHIAPMRDFAILRWYYSPESNRPELAAWKEAASSFLREAGKNTFVDDGAAVQGGRETGAAITNIKAKAAAAERIKKAARIWRELEQTGRPERERVAVIAARMGGAKPDTIRRWLKKAGLR